MQIMLEKNNNYKKGNMEILLICQRSKKEHNEN